MRETFFPQSGSRTFSPTNYTVLESGRGGGKTDKLKQLTERLKEEGFAEVAPGIFRKEKDDTQR